MDEKGTISNFRVIGGTLLSEAMKSGIDEKNYDIGKIFYWFEMLKEKKVPTKWEKSTKKGTKINFIYPQTQEEWDKSWNDLLAYIEQVNAKYGLDYCIR